VGTDIERKVMKDTRTLALNILRDQVRTQFDSRSRLDTNTGWLLGFLSIIITIIFTTGFGKGHTVTLYVSVSFFGLSFILAILAIIFPTRLEQAPKVEEFQKLIFSGKSEELVFEELAKTLSSNYLEVFHTNMDKLVRKQHRLIAGYLGLAAGLITLFILLIQTNCGRA
jgi:hypothetical protein